MAGTRSSARLGSQPKSSPTQPKESPKAAAGSKRKAENQSSPTPKRGRKAPEKKEQKTIEDTMDVNMSTDSHPKTQDDGDHSSTNQNGDAQPADQPQASQQNGQAEDKKEESQTSKSVEPTGEANVEQKPSTNGNKADDEAPKKAGSGPEAKADKYESEDVSKMDDTGKVEPKEDVQSKPEKNEEPATNGDSAIEPHARDEEVPSSILEKGIIYFFIRGRTGIDNPSNVGDIARSYMILRPIPHGAKIGEGTIGDGDSKCRLLALPKKVLPLNGKDKFMTFVEKSKTSFKELREEFMSGSDYTTQTVGVRHTPPVTPVAEGVYALTTTGRESHLAYITTIPQELSEVQKDIGIREQGSFITSTKNPQYAGPANTNLPQGPNFPKEILDEFRGLRWLPLQPKFLDYENTQFLLIGDSSGLENATQQQPGDEKKDDPKEELEKLEGEDEIRIKDLKGDDAVFADLGISKKEYPQVPTTWND